MENAKCAIGGAKPCGLYTGRGGRRMIDFLLKYLQAFCKGVRTQEKQLKEISSLKGVLHLF